MDKSKVELSLAKLLKHHSASHFDRERELKTIVMFLPTTLAIRVAVRYIVIVSNSLSPKEPNELQLLKQIHEWAELANRLEPIDYTKHHFSFWSVEKPNNPAIKLYLMSVDSLDRAISDYFSGNAELSAKMVFSSMMQGLTAILENYWLELSPETKHEHELFLSGEAVDEETLRNIQKFLTSPKRDAFVTTTWQVLAKTIKKHLDETQET